MKMALTLLTLLSTTLAQAQSTISPTNRYAYSANAGWLDALPSSADGVVVTDTYLTGYAYAANFGWISFSGAAIPTNGHTFSNATADDYGVNLSPSGQLSGYAYAANVGWILFEPTQGQPQLSLTTGIMSGSAYSANLGWISLATSSSILATTSLSRPDTDADGIPDGWENLHFGNLTTASATTDHDGDSSRDAAEYNAGTLPTNAASSFRITSQTFSSGFTQADLTYTTVPTRRYRIEYNSDLTPTWTNSTLGTFAPATTPANISTLTGLTATPRRFFRAVVINPL